MFKLNIANDDQINVAGIDVKVIRSKRKTIALQIQNGAAVLRSPNRASKKELRLFLTKHQSWLKDKLQSASEKAATYPPYPLNDGSEIDLFGQPIKLILCNDHSTKPKFESNAILLNAQHVERQLVPFLRQLSLEQAQQISDQYAALMGVKPNLVKVREYKRRWGTCHSNKSVTFNWRLVMAPTEIYQYVVVHELAHLIEFNHSKRFWHIVETYVPNWRDHRDWLAKNGLSLYRV